MTLSSLMIAGQIGGIVFGLAALAFYPPVDGKMILVPLTAEAANHVLPRARAGGAMLISAGPIRGSLVVSGNRRRLSASLAATMILAAPPAGCGTNTAIPA